MKDLFPKKKFKFEIINGVEYISKDTHDLLLKAQRDNMKKIIKDFDMAGDKYVLGSVLCDGNLKDELFDEIDKNTNKKFEELI